LNKEEKLLKKNGQKYQAIFEQVPVGVARVNIDGNFLEMNMKFCDIVGYSKKELLTKTFQDITHPDDLQTGINYMNQILNNEIKTYSMKKRYIKKDGDIVWINITVSLYRKINNYPDYFIGIVENTTVFNNLSILLEETQSLTKTGSWEYDIVKDNLTCSDELLKIHGFTDFSIKLEKDTLYNTFHPDDITKAKQDFVDSMSSKDITVSQNRAIRQNDGEIIYLEHRWKTEFKDYIAIRTVGTTQDITKQINDQNTVLENEKKYRGVFEQAAVGVARVSLDGRLLEVNKKFGDIVGYSKEELLIKTVEDITYTDDLEVDLAYVHQLLNNERETYTVNKRYISKYGDVIWANLTVSLVHTIDNKPDYFIAIVEDIQKLQASEERLKFSIEGSGDGLWDWDIQAKKVFYSKRWKEMIGYEENELSSNAQEWISRIHPEDSKQVHKCISAHIEGKTENYENEHRLKCKDGSYKWILARGMVVSRNLDGTPSRMVGSHNDISKRKETENLLKNLSDNIPSAIYQHRFYPNGTHTFPYASIGVKDIYELTPEEVMNNSQDIFDVIHPDDRELALEAIKKSSETMNLLNLDYRVQLPNKGLRWLRGQAKPEKLKDGSTLFHAFVDDITDKKNMEIELDERHAYLQSIIDGINDPIMVIKENYTIELMNNTLKKSIKDIKIEDPDNPKCYEVSYNRLTPCDGIDYPCPLRDVLENKQHTTVVHSHDTIDGENRYIELSASPLLDKDKNCIGIIEASRDITSHMNIQDELREQKNILDHQAHHDALTGLPNRVLFNDRLEQAIQTAKRKKTKFAVLFIDLDHFKEINDSLGHAVGDEILKTISNRLKENVRQEDTISRLGGDEFTVILEDLSLAQDASIIANKLLHTSEKSMNINDNILYVSSSIGISIYPDDGTSAQNLLKFADSAMYKAKNEGRNNFQYYDSSMTELAFERVFMETCLRDALKNEEFVVHYQPQVDGCTSKLIGMEALVRWQHPTMGLISPAKFIPLAETTGLIVELDRIVMKIAMTQITKWYEDGLSPGVLAMNLSIKQLKKTDFIEIFEQLMKETKCKAEWIELEVTESQIMTNPDEAINVLTRISDLGIELAVDDFGTGYSSLSYLKKLPIDKLKIDQTFVRDLPDDEEDAGITQAIIALAKALNLKVIAEGVETKEQKDFIVENGCDNIQGYFYSKPIPANEFEIILKNGSSIQV
jgi:diguanylate cyclase (GGDEF)-like protein/PAS domain S-box-containing protein